MMVKEWIKAAQANGWQVDRITGGKTISLKCSAIGCTGTRKYFLNGLDVAPSPCEVQHVHGHAPAAFDGYKALVGELQRRRRHIGLDQQDLANVIGLPDGYIAKLESFARIASPPTLINWCNALGRNITLAPATLPSATVKAIQDRSASPYQEHQARFKLHE